MSKQFPSSEAFEKLLRWLNSDRDQAGEKHEKVRFRLIRIFSCYGCCDPEDLADQTINVVCSKIDWLIENYVGDPALYFYGVAKNIYFEDLKKWKRLRQLTLPPFEESEIEQRCSCLEQCMKQHLSRAEQELILRYQEKNKQEKIKLRRQIAEELGISINALRIRVCHIHSRLRTCIEECLRHALDS